MADASVERGRGVCYSVRPERGRGRRRTLDDQLFARFPRLLRVLARAAGRLQPGTRLRRLLVVRRIERSYAAANRRDFGLVLDGTDPEVYEYRPSVDLLPPDLEPVFHGHDGYLQLWRYWTDAFNDIRLDPEEILDFGDTVLVTAQQSGHGSGSGVSVSERVFQVFTLRDGLVIRQQDFLDRTQALHAAGSR
jgi:ketosteroid isomerase-like protein